MKILSAQRQINDTIRFLEEYMSLCKKYGAILEAHSNDDGMIRFKVVFAPGSSDGEQLSIPLQIPNLMGIVVAISRLKEVSSDIGKVQEDDYSEVLKFFLRNFND